MDLAAHFSESPWSTKAEVVEAFGEESEHQDEIRNSQVQYQHVGRSTKSLESAEDLNDHGIAEQRGRTDEEIGQSQEVVKGGVDGLVGVPVRMEEGADVFRSVGIESEALRQSPWIERLSLLLGHSHN